MPLFRKQSAAGQTSLAPHDSKARLLSGRDSQGFMAKPCTPHPIAQRVQPFKLQTANAGGRGALPSPFSGGFKGGILFGKRIPPLVPRRARLSPSRARAGKSGHPFGTPRETRGALPLDPAALAVCSLKSCTACGIGCGVHGFAMNPCESSPLSTAPYYREARVTVVGRQTACGRHCCARRAQGCSFFSPLL